MAALVQAVSGFAKSGGLTSVLGLVSSGIGIAGQMSASEAEAKAVKASGKQALEKAQWEAEQKRKEGIRMGSRQKALYAKAGVSITAGSPLEVMADTASEYGADVAQLLRGGQQQYAMAKKQAKNIKTAGYWNMGTSILKGATGFMTSSLGQTLGLSK